MSGDRVLFHKLVSIHEVERIISKYIELKPIGTEVVRLEDSLSRIVAEDIYAPIDYPPFDRSEVDGYAVKAEDTYGADEENPVKLKIIGKVGVGEKPEITVSSGEAVEIATGAPIPKGADAVVMEEYTSRYNDYVYIYKPVAPGDHVATVASDISMGDLLVRRGELITPRVIALLASMGIDRVRVYKRVRVAVFSTGGEVVKPGLKLDYGQIYDVNSYYIISSLREIGINAYYAGHAIDDYKELYKLLSKELDKADVIITSGGTSAGLGDLVYRVIDELGEPGVIIHGLKVKPGKPTVVGVVNGKLIFGMPGFPLSCAMILDLVVKPVILKLAGASRVSTYKVKARFPYRLRAPAGKAWLIPVSIVKSPKGYYAYPVSLSSGSVYAISSAEGYVYVSEDKAIIDEGEVVDVNLFSKDIRIPELTVIGSHDVILYKILSTIELIDSSKIIPVGSLKGLYAASRGEADLAPTHILDEESMEYNKPVIEKLGLKNKLKLVRGYGRRIGFVVTKGNPKKISSFKDLIREDVYFVNRNRGSGIRVFVDYNLKKICREEGYSFDEIRKMIKGYTYEVRTHTAVAAAVAHGKADVGVASEIVAVMYNLEFIPLTYEVVDFAIPIDRLEKSSVKKFINELKSDRVRKVIEETPGYKVLAETGEIIL